MNLLRLALVLPCAVVATTTTTADFTFGDVALQFGFDPVTLAVRNVTARHASRTQGFVLGEARSLWQLNATNCSELVPKGAQVDGQSACAGRSHRVITNATTRTLALLWSGVQGLPGGAVIDVAVNITMASAHPGRASFSATATKHPGSAPLCIQFLALPNLPSLIGARDSDREWVFNPRAFGQTTEFVGAGSQQEEGDMNEAVAISLSGEGNWMPNVCLAPRFSSLSRMRTLQPLTAAGLFCALCAAQGDNTMQWMSIWTRHSASGTGPPVGLCVLRNYSQCYLRIFMPLVCEKPT